jgi:hypothetical protein
MSTHIVGFRPADEKWNKMKATWLACEDAGVPIPEEVKAFFHYESPGDKPGIEVEIKEALREWTDDCRQGYEVDLTKLPPDVKVLRFYNSW